MQSSLAEAISVSMRRSKGELFFVASSLLALGCLIENPAGWASELCRELVERGVVFAQEGEVITVARAPGGLATRGVRVGDRVEQINGVAVRTCADVARAVASARRRKVAVVALVERKGEQIPVLLELSFPKSGSSSRETDTNRILVHPEAKLPTRASARVEVVRGAKAALEAIRRLEKAARAHGSYALYSHRLAEAENTIDRLGLGRYEGGAEVSAFAGQILEYHRQAVRMWRLKLTEAERLGYDRRALHRPLPYFSGSEVESWVARYPALEETIVSEPNEVNMLMPGEGSGLWDADRALEIIWKKARRARRELERWLARTS